MKPENKNPYEINDTQQAVPVGDNYKGYTQHNNPELADIETFNRNWYNYRGEQLYNWYTNPEERMQRYTVEGDAPDLAWFGENSMKNWSKEDILKVAKRYIGDRLSSLKEYNVDELPESETKNVPWWYDAWYNRPNHRIVYRDPEDRKTSLKIHEREHALRSKYLFYDAPFGYNRFKHFNRLPGVEYDSYLDNKREIKSRLMQLRFLNKLDPEHKYNIFEIRNMRKDPNFEDYRIFERYDDETILNLLNKVAQNTNNPYSDPNRARV